MSMTAGMVLVFLIYLRVSTEDQAKHGYSLPDQREQCRNLVLQTVRRIEAEEGVHVDHQIVEFEDTMGGDLLERPVLEDVREFVRGQRPNYFICMDPDRFSRDLYIQLLVTREIEAVGCQLVFVQHNYQKTPEGIMFFQLRGAIAQFEKAKILERTTRGARRKLREGKLPHHIWTFGYKYNTTTDQVDVLEEEAVWVRQIFQWAAERILPSDIRDRLNSLGVSTKRGGGVWYSSTIRGMLRNTTYTGVMQCNRYDWRGMTSLMRLPKERRKQPIRGKLRPESEWIQVPVPAIIDKALFDEVQKTFRRQKAQAKRGTGLLSGLARCGLCGGAIHYVEHGDGNYNLRCINRYAHSRDILNRPAQPCTLPHLRAAIAERAAWEQTIELLTNPDMHIARIQTGRDEVAATNQKASLEATISQLRAAMNENRKHQASTANLMNRNLLDKEVAEGMLADDQRALAEMTAQLRKAESALEMLLSQDTSPEGMRRRLETVREKFEFRTGKVRGLMEAMDPAKRQKVLRMALREVRIYPGRRVEIVPV